jgi:hypothetical protein
MRGTITKFALIGRWARARIKQSEKVDPRGFIADQWERLE